MNQSAIDDQNNDNIIDEPQDILEDYVDNEDKDDEENNNEFTLESTYWPFSTVLLIKRNLLIYLIVSSIY